MAAGAIDAGTVDAGTIDAGAFDADATVVDETGVGESVDVEDAGGDVAREAESGPVVDKEAET